MEDHIQAQGAVVEVVVVEVVEQVVLLGVELEEEEEGVEGLLQVLHGLLLRLEGCALIELDVYMY